MVKNQGVKPNDTWTHTYLKAYVKALGLNHPEVKMNMNKANMIAGLKAAKHWGPRAPSFPASKMTAKGGPKSMRGASVAPAPKVSAKAKNQAKRVEVGRAVLGQNMARTASFNSVLSNCLANSLVSIPSCFKISE